MKQQRLKFKLLALILFGMFALLAVYGGYSISTYGNRWFASNKNPRVRTQKDNVTAGNVLDTNGIILATTVDGERVYQADEAARRAIVHLLGDSQGQVSNGVETFQTSYLYGFQTSLPELILSTFRGNGGETTSPLRWTAACARRSPLPLPRMRSRRAKTARQWL